MPNPADTVLAQRTYFASGATRDVAFRRRQLIRLRDAVQKNEGPLCNALQADLGKSAFEAYETEIGLVLGEISFMLRHLDKWCAPQKVKTSLFCFPARSRTLAEPRGVCLIMSPWNYPVQLTLMPLAAAIGAGNCAVVKPSAYAPYTAAALAKLLGDLFPAEYVSVIEGGRDQNQALLEQRYDHIFFSGSPAVGRTVLAAAARHLTPVTLELGGKSPCIVDESATIDTAARRIVWGKFLNAGQTCVAPDYLLVHRSLRKEFTKRLLHWIKQFWGEHPLNHPDLPHIINRKHFDRLTGLLNGQTPLCGGQSDAQTLCIAPTVVDDVSWDSPLMQDELFGPLLPVLYFDDLDEVIAQLNTQEKPLALYLFSNYRPHINRLLHQVSFGGGCINDTIMHVATPHLPFGGVGQSGLGSYHGRQSFETFSHRKSLLMRSDMADPRFRYMPYTGKLDRLRRLMKRFF